MDLSHQITEEGKELLCADSVIYICLTLVGVQCSCHYVCYV